MKIPTTVRNMENYLTHQSGNKKYYKLNPEVPGHFGDNTIIEKSVNSYYVKKLHYIFDGWQGDDILSSHPIFMVTERLKDQLLSSSFIDGFILKELIKVETSEEYHVFFGEKSIPPIFLLEINGKPYINDFGVDENNDLIVSHNSLEILKKYNMNFCDIEKVG